MRGNKVRKNLNKNTNNMCGIYGSASPEEFYKLQEINKLRGNYGTGYLHIGKEGYAIQKFKETSEVILYPQTSLYNLGHNRAPTTNEKGRGLSCSHPFNTGRAISAHNGILINTLELEEKWKTEFPVDSQWVSFLYDKYYKQTKNCYISFKLTLEHISGTYAIWLYDIEESIVFVSRGDNSIFWNDQKNVFSSIQTSNCKNLMPEGAIYQSIQNFSSFEDKNENDRLKRHKKYFIL
jgi:glucosamine 6-phosphate synthetase-like amidotransferase/phosphosugar isomerase protein